MRVLLLALVIALAGAATARACSCAGPGDPREEIERAVGAAYGEILARSEKGRYRMRVVQDFKGNLPKRITFRNPFGDACGRSGAPGDRVGLLFYQRGGQRLTNACLERTRAHLQEGADALPAPAAEPPADVLIGGAFGSARTAGLDAAGRIVGYGKGQGTVIELAPCPGGEVVLELVLAGRSETFVAARTVFGFTSARPVSLPGDSFPSGVECQSADGRQAAVLAGGPRLLQLDDGTVRTLWRGGRRGTALLAGGRVYTRSARVDTRTGEAERFGPLAKGNFPLALSPDGSTLAVRARRGIELLDAGTARVLARREQRAFSATWITDERLAVLGRGGTSILDRRLQPIARLEVFPQPAAVDDGELLVVDSDRLLRFDADGKQVGAAVRLFTSAAVAVCAL